MPLKTVKMLFGSGITKPTIQALMRLGWKGVEDQWLPVFRAVTPNRDSLPTEFFVDFEPAFLNGVSKFTPERSGWHALLRHPRLITGRIGICRRRTDEELQRLVALGHGEDVPEPHIVDTVARRKCSIAANYLLPLVPTHRRFTVLWHGERVASAAGLSKKQRKERHFG